MLTVVAFVLSFVASTFAYTVTFPNDLEGWTNSGSQFVNWTTVDTDPTNFTVQLTNQNLSGFVNEILIALVVGSSLSATVDPPSAGWVPASDYRVNFVKDPEDLDTILAQSNPFNITSSSTTSSTSGTSGTSGTATVVLPTASTTPTTGTTGASTLSASDSGVSILPTSSSAAALSYPVQTGLLGLFSLIGFALA